MTRYNLYKIIQLVLLWITAVQSAFVASNVCGADKGLNISSFQFTTFLTNASYNEDTQQLVVQLTGFSLGDIIDVNATTNMFTTLHVVLKYVDQVMLDEYYRFCDIVSVNHNTNYIIPHRVFSLPGRSSYYKPTPFSFPPPSSALISSSELDTATQVQLIYPTSNVLLNTEGEIQKETEPANITPSTALITATPEIPITSSSSLTSTTGLNSKSTSSSSLSSSISKAQETDDSLIPVGISKKRNLVERDDFYSGTCPIFANNEVIITVPFDCEKRSVFGSYFVEISIISPDSNHSVLACTESWITLKQPRVLFSTITGVLVAVAGLILLNAAANYVFSPYQDSDDLFLFAASRICNAPLLNQLSPDYTDYIKYLHYILFMTALNLYYPGFFQPLIGDLRWVALMISPNDVEIGTIGNVYQTIFTGGLRLLANTTVYQDAPTKAWKLILINFGIYCGGVIVLLNLFYVFAILCRRNIKYPSFKHYFVRSCLASIGMLLDSFLETMRIPILVFAFYLISNLSGDPYGGPSGTSLYHGWSVATTAIFISAFFLLHFFFIATFVLSSTGRQKLYKSLHIILIWINLYQMFEPARVWFIIIDIIEVVIFVIAVGCLQNNAVAQLSLIIASQGLYLISLLVFKPYYSKTRMNRNRMSLSIAKLVTSFLHIPFLQYFTVSETVKTRFVWVILIVHCLVIILLFIFPTFRNMYLLYKSTKKSPQYGENRVGLPFEVLPNVSSIYITSKASLNEPYTSEESANTENPVGHLSNLELDNINVHHVPAINTPTTLQSETFASYNNSPQAPRIRHHASMAFSLISNEIKFTDKRVVPFLNSGAVSQNVSNSNLVNSNSQVDLTEKKERDWTTREADYFYNAYRILEPDPEVKRLWDERVRRLDQANTAKKSSGSDFGNTSEAASKENTNNNNSNTSNLIRRIFMKSRMKDIEPETKGFEVMRPRLKPLPMRDTSSNVESSIASTGRKTTRSSTPPDESISESEVSSTNHRAYGRNNLVGGSNSMSSFEDSHTVISQNVLFQGLRVVNNGDGDFSDEDDEEENRQNTQNNHIAHNNRHTTNDRLSLMSSDQSFVTVETDTD